MIDQIPDFTQPIVGWRGWRFGEIFGVLYSTRTSSGTIWPPGEPLEAECNLREEIRAVAQKIWKDDREGKFKGPIDFLTLKSMERDVSAANDFRERLGQPPHEDHPCGIYAVPSDRTKHIPTVDIMGAVELTGKIVPATHGWRAQRARIICLRAPLQWRAVVQPLLGANIKGEMLMDMGREEIPGYREMQVRFERVADLYGVPLVNDLPPTTDPKEVMIGEHREGR